MLFSMDEGSVTFVERGGADARQALRVLQERLDALGCRSRLLASRDERDLHLLMIEGDPLLSEAERDRARTWRFRDAASDGADGTSGGAGA